MEKELIELQKESDEAYKSIENFVDYYFKSDKDKKEFFKNLSEYLEAEIEIGKLCNQ